MTDEVALRPVRKQDLDMLEGLTQDPAQTGEFEWSGWSDRWRWRRGWEDGLIGPDGGTLIEFPSFVAGQGPPRGREWRRQPPGVMAPAVGLLRDAIPSVLNHKLRHFGHQP